MRAAPHSEVQELLSGLVWDGEGSLLRDTLWDALSEHLGIEWDLFGDV